VQSVRAVAGIELPDQRPVTAALAAAYRRATRQG
jgi:hypothetical protein